VNEGMFHSEETTSASFLARRIGLFVVAAMLGGFVIAVLAGSPARANPGVGSPASPTSCPNQAYNTSTTIANCRPTTTTTTGSASFTLTASYHTGHLSWQACAGAAAQGSTVQLYVDGSPISASNGGSTTIGSNGCTAATDATVCLARGSHTVTATDEPYGSASQTVDVRSNGCQSPTVAAASSAQAGGSTTGPGSHTSGFLAFTGADIALMILGAALLLGLGFAIVRMSRQRRRAV
jgi:hypothetical protein